MTTEQRKNDMLRFLVRHRHTAANEYGILWDQLDARIGDSEPKTNYVRTVSISDDDFSVSICITVEDFGEA